jgi:radical SAM superfamily enzyme YgiQ (UPF0313 family)
MNVLLLNAPWHTESGFGVRSNSRWAHTRKDKVLPFPVYLGYTAALLEKNNITVKVIDAVANDITIKDIIKCIKKDRFDLVVIETTTPSIKFDLIAAKSIKENCNIKVVFVGPHATTFDAQLLKENQEVDFIIRGEFDYAILDLCKVLSSNGLLSKVEGLTYRDQKNNVIKNPNKPLIENLDEMPIPARHLFNMKKYDSHLYKSPSFLMISSRGCPYQCTYCLWPQTMYGHKFRFRSAKNVVDEMELLVNKYKAKEICFDDDTFTVDKKRVIQICEEIVKRRLKIEWSCFGRVGIDEETLRAMKEAGCEHIRYGVESGAQEILDRCKKNVNIKDIIETFKLTKKVGIHDYGTFMIGLPGETWKSIEQTINLAIKLNPYAVQFAMAIPFPGTEFYDEAKQRGFIRKGAKWSEFDGSASGVVRTEALTRADLDKAFALAWKRFYLRPQYVISSLIRHLRSIQDMKRLFKGTKSFFVRWMYYRKKLKNS